jgi:hypothetical protein
VPTSKKVLQQFIHIVASHVNALHIFILNSIIKFIVWKMLMLENIFCISGIAMQINSDSLAFPGLSVFVTTRVGKNRYFLGVGLE